MTARSESHSRRLAAARIAKQVARSEDLAWLAETGETTEGAARRLGIKLESLDRWCAANNPAAWAALRRNEERVA